MIIKTIRYIIFLFFVSVIYANDGTKNKINVVCSTTLISSILEQIGKDKVNTITIIPGGVCPGHFDLPIGIITDLYNSKIFFYHGWEKWLDKIFSKQYINIRMIKLSISGNWMIPDINKKAAIEIKNYLCEIDVENIKYYEKNLDDYVKKLDEISENIKKDFVKNSGKKVISSVMQKEFLEWLGLDVLMTYGRTEELNVKKIKTLVEVAKKHNVKVFVDNLQSGANTAKNIAKDIKARHIFLSNFPDRTYFETLEENIKKLKEVLE